jgi:putative flippase GtrA
VTRETLGQVLRVGVIGGFNTIVYFIVLNLMRWTVGLSSFLSVTIAFAVGTALSYVMNRRWSFQIADGSVGNMRESSFFFVVNTLAWAATAAVVEISERVWGPLGPVGLNAAAVVATGFVILPKFAAYRDLVFRRSLEQARV